MNIPEQVAVHPLVLLSVVDHYNRVKPVSGKRIVGVLLGRWTGTRQLHVTNSYAIPFEENENDPTIWFLDHNYHENMSELFKKVSAKETPVGWYHTGPKLRSSDLRINELFKKYCHNPILIVINPLSEELGLPLKSYMSIDEIKEDGTMSSQTFVHVMSCIEAEEAEEIGVEHLLRDVQESTPAGTQSQQLYSKLQSLRALANQLSEIELYLEGVIAGKLPINHTINRDLQELFNLMPDYESIQAKEALVQTTNDQLMMTFIGELGRSVIALHDLIDNKLEAKQQQQQQQQQQISISK